MKTIWKILIGIVIIAVIVGGYLVLRRRSANHANQSKYTTVEVKRGSIVVKILATGTVQPYTRVEFRSPVSGRIESVVVDERAKVKPGDVLAWISSEDRTGLLDAARSGLKLAQRAGDTSALAEAEKAYEVADKAYEPIPLTSSIAGEIINRSCQPGQNVTPTDVLFALCDRLVAQAQVDEADIGKIRLHQAAWIVLDAFPDERIRGQVTKISREGTTVSDVVVYNVMVDPVKVPAEWASGMTADVEFMVDRKDDILVVPKSAVNERDGGKFVMVINGGLSSRKIETGITDGKMIEVTKGLTGGETVAIGATGAAVEQRSSRRPPMMMVPR